MKDLVILILISILVFLILNGRQTATYDEPPVLSASSAAAPVPPEIIQVILSKVQQSINSVYPLETLYVKNVNNDVYDARFMFFHTEGYYGTQYDVKASIGSDGSVTILSQSETAITDDTQNPGYVPDKYQSYEVIEENLNRQLQDALKNAVRPDDASLSGRLAAPIS